MKDLQLIYLTNLLTAAVMMEGIEALQGTTAYRQELKNTANRFMKELERYCSEPLGAVWGADDKAMYALMEYQKKVIAQLVTMRPEDIGVVSELIEKYLLHPEEVLTRLEIQIVDSENVPA